MKALILSAIMLVSGLPIANADNHTCHPFAKIQSDGDSVRLAELDRYWAELSRTVVEGDFDAYKAAYHEDAVIVFASGNNKMSMSISEALERWKQGFMDTKNGKRQDQVEFRFSQRIGSETTAHETGIFIFTSADNNGKILAKYITHFEMLLVKREGRWYALMEYQKGEGTPEEWDALQ